MDANAVARSGTTAWGGIEGSALALPSCGLDSLGRRSLEWCFSKASLRVSNALGYDYSQPR